MKKFYFLALIPMIFVAVFAASVYAQTATPPSAGDGTAGNPWQIATLNNLYWITQNSGYWSGTNSNFIQTADIVWSGGGYIPIGGSTWQFSGTYNGNNHTITNLSISRGSFPRTIRS